MGKGERMDVMYVSVDKYWNNYWEHATAMHMLHILYKVIKILSRQGLTACPLLHENKKKEIDTETEKNIYYAFRSFRDCSNKKLLRWWLIASFRAYLVTILKTLILYIHTTLQYFLIQSRKYDRYIITFHSWSENGLK